MKLNKRISMSKDHSFERAVVVENNNNSYSVVKADLFLKEMSYAQKKQMPVALRSFLEEKAKEGKSLNAKELESACVAPLRHFGAI